jgi:hypothetical protein
MDGDALQPQGGFVWRLFTRRGFRESRTTQMTAAAYYPFMLDDNIRMNRRIQS